MSQLLQHTKIPVCHNKFRFIPAMQGWFNIQESINVIHQITTVKDRNNIFISIDILK